MNFILFWALLLHADGGVKAVQVPLPPSKAAIRPEDPEVVKNLELLELLDETSELELLQELAVER